MADMWARSRLTASPPLRPATRASSEVNSCAVPLAWAARPPLLAISRCFVGSIDAKPRLLVLAMCVSFGVQKWVLRALRCPVRGSRSRLHEGCLKSQKAEGKRQKDDVRVLLPSD